MFRKKTIFFDLDRKTLDFKMFVIKLEKSVL